MSRQGRRGGRRGGRDRAIRSALEDHEDHLQFVHVSLRPSLPLCLCLPTGAAGGRGQSCRAGPTHPAVGERGERSRSGTGRTFHLSLLTGYQRVRLAWRATSANVVKMKLKLLSAGIVVGVILRVII